MGQIKIKSAKIKGPKVAGVAASNLVEMALAKIAK